MQQGWTRWRKNGTSTRASHLSVWILLIIIQTWQPPRCYNTRHKSPSQLRRHRRCCRRKCFRKWRGCGWWDERFCWHERQWDVLVLLLLHKSSPNLGHRRLSSLLPRVLFQQRRQLHVPTQQQRQCSVMGYKSPYPNYRYANLKGSKKNKRVMYRQDFVKCVVKYII